MKSAEVSCTQFCSKTTQLHSPTKKIDFELDSLSCMKEFTWCFTNNFVILTEAFRALRKLDPESLFIHWPKKLPFNTVNPNLTKRNTKTNTQQKWIFRAERCIRRSGKLIYFSQFCFSFYRNGFTQWNRLKCPSLSFALKQLNCILPQRKSTSNYIHFLAWKSLRDASQTTSWS